MQTGRAGRFTFPPLVSRLAVGRMALAPESRLVTTKGQTKKITPKHSQHRRQVPGSGLLRPRRDGEWLNPFSSDPKGHRAKVTAGLGDKGLDLTRRDAPGRLGELQPL